MKRLLPALGLVLFATGAGAADTSEPAAALSPQPLVSLGGRLPPSLPLLPPDNWWNRDISTWPVDPNSTDFIDFINDGGGCQPLHPDFGGIWPAPPEIIGFPFVVVDTLPRRAVQFEYWDESDGVDYDTELSFPFYPIPDQAITQPYFIEGGPPGNQCVGGDRHMLIIDRNYRHLYELFALCWDGSQWTGGSGAFFDLKTNNRRPEGWTSADAAGLAIFPGLVRYDEAFGPDEIDHAFRFTVRDTNGHVYPASHTAGDNPLALPMGARLRLKASKDISGELPYIQKIFRAMKTYGLIVADNGSDMYISGTHDTRWDNGQLNPAFGRLTACDFEVITLGHNPAPAAPTVTQVQPATGTTAGGTALRIRGTGFNTGASVSIGGVPATSVTVLRSTQLLAVTSPRAAGLVNVVVTNPDAQSGSLAGGFTYCGNPPAAPALTVAKSVNVDASGVSASVAPVAATVYSWSLLGGTLTSGNGTSQIAFDAGPPGTTMRLRVDATAAACSSAATSQAVQVDFLDVQPPNGFREYVNTIARHGITLGCGGGNYCAESSTTRAQMAVFLLRSKYGGDYQPPPATGTTFADVPANAFAAAFIERLAQEGITTGCAVNPARYCPENPVTREQMAVFLLRTRYGSGHTPPPATGVFQDVPASNFYAPWIEQLADEGVTLGCDTNPPRYCPQGLVTRAQMAAFLTRMFALQ